jgi:hypothetical protein
MKLKVRAHRRRRSARPLSPRHLASRTFAEVANLMSVAGDYRILSPTPRFGLLESNPSGQDWPAKGQLLQTSAQAQGCS